MVSRCFAFEPNDNQADDMQQVVMIPNQNIEQISFYISTMMTDFAVEFTRRMADIINGTEKRHSVLSPPLISTAHAAFPGRAR